MRWDKPSIKRSDAKPELLLNASQMPTTRIGIMIPGNTVS